MQLVVFTAVATAMAIVSYAFGQGGPIAGLIFLTILFIGAFLRVAEPIISKLRGS